jgi:uncharacterized protein YqgC (DUF456 family)
MKRIGTLMLLLLSLGAFAADPVAVKSWAYQDFGNGSTLALTKSNRGAILGVYCALGGCQIVLGTSMACRAGNHYTSLASSDSGARAVEGTCINISSAAEKPRYVLALSDFTTMLTVLLQDHSIAFAVPAADGTFVVVRFSLEGANEALAAINHIQRDQAQPNKKAQVL